MIKSECLMLSDALKNNSAFAAGAEALGLWKIFLKVIDKANDACHMAGSVIDNHFRGVTKMVYIGSGAERADSECLMLIDLEKNELVANCYRFSTLKHSVSLPYVFAEQGESMLCSCFKIFNHREHRVHREQVAPKDVCGVWHG